MAGSDSSSTDTGRLPEKAEKKHIAINISIPRRKVTLIIITLLLNFLHWSSIFCLITSFYHIGTHADDATSVPSEILTLTSGIATISYIYFHTIISIKQRTWIRQGDHASTIKRTSYAAVRFAVSLCALWLLTAGWNMIIVARRPLCVSSGLGLEAWEVGTACHIARLGMALAMICLVTSFALFGVLAVVRRPFEAHLFKHGYQAPLNPFVTPALSRSSSPVPASEKRGHGKGFSISSRRTASVTTLDLSHSPSPLSLHAPSPRRSVGLEIFTSNLAPPPIPPEFVPLPRHTSMENLPTSRSHHSLILPPRLSGHTAPYEGNVFANAPQFSASTLRALHPATSTATGLASRSYSHLPTSSFSYPSHRYSRSSVSLTRPHRLSSRPQATSVSNSESTGRDGQETSTSAEDSTDERSPDSDVPFASLNGTSSSNITRGEYHMRTSSASDTTSGAQPPLWTDRMAMGWKPQLAGSQLSLRDQKVTELFSVPLKPARKVRSSSMEMSNVNAKGSAESFDEATRRSLEGTTAQHMKELPFKKSRSADTLVSPTHSAQASGLDMAGKEQTRVLHSEARRKRRMTYDEMKNKPLPKIATL